MHSNRALAFALLCGVLAVGGAIALLFQRDPRAETVDAPTARPSASLDSSADDPLGPDPSTTTGADAVDSPRRAPTASNVPLRFETFKVRGITVREDSKMPVRCVFRAYDDQGAERTIRRAQRETLVFELSVDTEATRLVVEAADAFDLDPVTVRLARDDASTLRIELPLAKGSIHGLVQDETGAGVPGVRVRLNYGRAVRTTHSDGRFAFGPLRDDDYVVDLEREAYSSLGTDADQRVDVVQGAQATPVTFSVRRGSTLRVRVVDDANDEPLEGVTIGISGVDGREARRGSVTDADGFAEIHHLLAGSYDVSARPAQAGMSRSVRRVDALGELETRTVELRITHGAGDLDGAVEGPDGTPQPFARLIAVPEPGSAGTRTETRADSAGTFAFRGLPPGTYRVVADPEYCRTYNWLASSSDVVEVRSGELAHTRVVLRLGARIDGVLISPSRRGALVARLSADGTARECPIADGRFAFSGLDGGFYRVEVVDPSNGGGAVLFSSGVQLAASATERVRVELP